MLRSVASRDARTVRTTIRSNPSPSWGKAGIMWGSGEVLHLGGGGEHVPRARPTGEPVAVRVPGSAEEGQALGAELGRGFPERGAPPD